MTETSKLLIAALGVLECEGRLRLREKEIGFVAVYRPKGAEPTRGVLLNMDSRHWTDPVSGEHGFGYYQLMTHLGIDRDAAMAAMGSSTAPTRR